MESLETGRDFSEIYSERLTLADAENQKFYEDFPAATAALSIGGAVLGFVFKVVKNVLKQKYNITVV